ncbi:hypothetical protein D3C80_269190 [compost metagenome]
MGEQLNFSIGEAIAILSITLAVPQFARPVVLFRLRAQKLRLSWLYTAVFFGCFLAVIAALAPRLFWLPQLLQWSLFWELLATAIFVAVFAIFSSAFLWAPSVRKGGFERYIIEAAAFLAHADDQDRAEFSRDLLTNIVRITNASSFAANRRDISAFFAFAHRKEMSDAGYANSFLQLIAEPQFCSVLVSATPWDAAAIVRRISVEKAYSRAAQSFVQEVARQAIVAPNSMLGREVGFKGFNFAPVLSDAIFSSSFLRSRYEPLSFFGYSDFDSADPERLSRLRHAVELQLSMALSEQDYWADRSLIHLPDYFRSALLRIRKLDRSDEKAWRPASEIAGCLKTVIDSVRSALTALRESGVEHDRELYDMLFLREDGNAWQASLLNCAAETVVVSLFTVSNDFTDHDDVFWHLLLDVMDNLVPRNGIQPNGVDPFQQRVILKLISKLKDNMRGNYPAVSRSLLAALAPLDDTTEVNRRSAYMLLKRALYRELKAFPDLYGKNQKKALDKLPKNVRFDAETTTLYRLYRSREVLDINLKNIRIREVNLFDERQWLKNQ